jgi:DNA-binding transcriptional ArsR family regulator
MTTFEVLAEPSRRLILDLLAQGDLPVGELVARMGMSQPAVSKHLRVLREAGLVSATVDAQRRVYRIETEPLRELAAWLAKFWTNKLDALERSLED